MRQNKVFTIISTAFLIILLDQLSKRYLLDFFANNMGNPLYIAPWLNLVYVFNYGITFGIMSDIAPNSYLLAGIAGSIAIFLFILVLRSSMSRQSVYYHSSIIGGALGNVVDRLTWGGVFDFIDFHWHDYHYPAFNVADIFIVCGIFMILCEEIRK
jgi:signal peptidase II